MLPMHTCIEREQSRQWCHRPHSIGMNLMCVMRERRVAALFDFRRLATLKTMRDTSCMLPFICILSTACWLLLSLSNAIYSNLYHSHSHGTGRQIKIDFIQMGKKNRKLLNAFASHRSQFPKCMVARSSDYGERCHRSSHSMQTMAFRF